MDCDGDALVVLVDQHGRGACHTGRADLLLPDHRHGPGSARAVTAGGRSGPRTPWASAPTRPSSPRWPRSTPSCPVWCEVVADTLTPVACFANVVGEGDGFLFESVEGGERWGRYSFVGRRPLATLTARGRTVEATGHLGLARSDDGILAAVEDLVARFRVAVAGRPAAAARGAGRVPRLRRRARGRAAARRRPTTTWATPTRRWSSSGSSAPSTTGASASSWSTTSWCPTRPTACRRRRGGARRLRGRLRPAASSWRRTAPRPGSAPRDMVAAPPAGPRAGRGEPDDDVGGVPGRHRRGQGVHPGRRHLPGRALAALRPRARGRPLRRLPGPAPAQPEPVPLLPALPRGDRRRRVARADGAPARRRRDLAADRRLAATRARTSSTTGCSRASWPRTPRSWPSTSCWSTWPATTSGGSCASAPRRSTSS